MTPCPSSSTRRYRPPRTVPISVKRPPSLGTRVDAAQVRPELRRQVWPGQCDVDRGHEPAHRGAGVVAGALELIRVDRLLVHERLDRVGQLDLAAGAALGLLELVEDLRRQDVAPDDGEGR